MKRNAEDAVTLLNGTLQILTKLNGDYFHFL